ncbi:hypothetical protein Droror1_Dr00010417 [Drosera rotundifolia]
MALFSTAKVMNLTEFNGRTVYCTMEVAGSTGLYSRGIWFKDDVLSRMMPITMGQLSIFFAISYSLFFAFRPLRLPKIVCDAAAGIIMGPSFLGRYDFFAEKFLSPKQFLMINTIATLGVFYNVFVVAVKMDITMITRIGNVGRRIAVSCLIAPFVVLLTLVTVLRPKGLPQGSMTILFVANSSVSAFINLIPILEENNLLSKDLAQLAMSASAMCESLVWVVWISITVSQQPDIIKCIGSAVLLLAVIGFIVLLVRPAMMKIVQKTPEGQHVKDCYVVIILIFVPICAMMSNAIAGTALLGTLVLGLVTPDGPPLGSALTERIETILNTCLLPFFFLSIGAAADMSSAMADWQPLLKLQSIMIAGYLAKLLGAMLPSLLSGMSFRHSLILGLMLNTKGVMELHVYRLMVLHKFTSVPVYTRLVCSAMALTAIVGPLAKFLYEAPVKSEKGSQAANGLTLQSSFPESELRIVSCVHKEDDVPGLIDLLEACNPTKSTPICLYMVHLMELVGRNAPTLSPHPKHHPKCKHNGCLRIMAAFSNYFTSSRGEVTIQPFSLAAFYRSMHEGICRLALDKRAPLIIVPFIARNQSHVEGYMGSSKINCNIQACAQCTVGILVDRAIHTYRGPEYFSYHIAIVFIGGQDDREALALAARMSGHPGIMIRLFRVIIHNESLSTKRDRELNRTAIKEFRTKNFSNERVSYQEIRVEDWDHAIRAIRSLASESYDLIMVGRRQSESGLLQEEEEEMAILIENPELGMVGDMLISSDFRGGTVSVLVMQHHRTNVDPSVLDSSIRVEDEPAYSSGSF